MASAFRRPRHEPDGKWTAKYQDEAGKWRTRLGFVSRKQTLALARKLEDEARAVREGLVDPRAKARQQAELRAVADHVADYRAALLAKGDTVKHADHTSRTLTHLLAAANIGRLSDLTPDRVQGAVGHLQARNRHRKAGVGPASARTKNFALGAVKAFVAWLHDAGRLAEVPRGMKRLGRYNQDADRRRVRRALTPEQLDALLAATEAGPTIVAIRPGGGRKCDVLLSGPGRAMLYRLAAGTGFRANELRTLTPECFRLDGEDPSVVVKAAYAKNGKEAVQPIRRDLAELLRLWLEGRPAGEPVVPVPTETAKMLRDDLERAGIPYEDEEGRVADFHSLRAAYITGLVRSGVDPATAQRLARHSDVRLTLSVYVTTGRADLRKALEGKDDGQATGQ